MLIFYYNEKNYAVEQLMKKNKIILLSAGSVGKEVVEAVGNDTQMSDKVVAYMNYCSNISNNEKHFKQKCPNLTVKVTNKT